MQGTDELIALGRRMRDAGMTWASSGNLSLRTDAGIAMTASGSRLSALDVEDVILVALDGTVVDAAEGRSPSKEAGMHRAVYRANADAYAVVHASPVHATLVACTDLDLPVHSFPEGMMHLESLRRVRYEHAGSEALARAVGEASREAQVLLLENHGALAWAASADDAALKLEVLEFAARLAVLGRAANLDLTPLPAERVREFQSSGYRR